MEEIENKLRKRATRARNLAQAGILVIIFVVLTIIAAMFMFFKSPEVAFSSNITPSAIEFSEKPVETVGDLKGVIEELTTEIKSVSSQNTTVMGDFQTVYLINTLTSSFIRISAVALAIFLTQVLVNFTRYQFRIADHLDAVADAIVFSNGDSSQFETFVGSVSPQHIDFGKHAESPSDKMIETVKAAIEGIPKVGS
jgi:predicted PurR-regulated permease PerM